MRPFVSFLAQWLCPSRSQYWVINSCLPYLASLLAEINRSISEKLDGLNSNFQWEPLIQSGWSWVNHQTFSASDHWVWSTCCEVLRWVLTQSFLRQAMAPFCPCLDSPMKMLEDKKPKLKKKTFHIKEIRWKKWNYELCKERGCWVHLPTSNPEVFDLQVRACSQRHVFAEC